MHIDICFVDVVGVVPNDARIQFFGVVASKYDFTSLTTTVVATAVAFKQMFGYLPLLKKCLLKTNCFVTSF